MKKVLVACGCGMGSSQVLKMMATSVLKELGIDHTMYHTSIDEAKSIQRDYDLIIVSETFVNNFTNGNAIVVGLKNLMSKPELKEKLSKINLEN